MEYLLDRVEKLIPIWPPLWEQRAHMEKWELEKDLDYVAKMMTKTGQPEVQLTAPEKRNWVAKR